MDWINCRLARPADFDLESKLTFVIKGLLPGQGLVQPPRTVANRTVITWLNHVTSWLATFYNTACKSYLVKKFIVVT